MNKAFKLLICDADSDTLLRWAMTGREIGLEVVLSSTHQEALVHADFHQPQIALLRESSTGPSIEATIRELGERSSLATNNVVVVCNEDEPTSETSSPWIVVTDESLMSEALERIVARLSAESALPDEADSVEAMLSEWGWVSASDANEAPQECESSRPWVLAIDDDPDFTLGLEKRLATMGVGLVRAYRGMEGFRSAFESLPAAILLDYEMPDGNGEYILRRLKDSPATREVPVIMITGVRDLGLKRRMLLAGACEFMTKPVTWLQVRDQLHQWTDLEMTVSS